MRKRALKVAGQEAWAKACFQAQSTVDMLTRCAEEIELKPVPARPLHPGPQPVLDVVCLLAESRFAALRRQVEESGKDLAASGFHMELSGPWPPYHFSMKAEDDVIAR